MKMYVFERIEQVTDNCHPEGGLSIVAENRERAEELLLDEAFEYIHITEQEWDEAVVYDLKGNPEPRVFIFPDAGCC